MVLAERPNYEVSTDTTRLMSPGGYNRKSPGADYEDARLIPQPCGIRKPRASGTNNTHLKNTQLPPNPPLESRANAATLVFEDRAESRGFTQVPNVVMKDGRLSAAARLVYCLLRSYAWQNNECFPGQAILAKDMGCSPDSIQRALHRLKKAKLIDWKRQGLGKPNLYLIKRLSEAYPQCVDGRMR